MRFSDGAGRRNAYPRYPMASCYRSSLTIPIGEKHQFGSPTGEVSNTLCRAVIQGKVLSIKSNDFGTRILVQHTECSVCSPVQLQPTSSDMCPSAIQGQQHRQYRSGLLDQLLASALPESLSQTLNQSGGGAGKGPIGFIWLARLPVEFRTTVIDDVVK